ncbi:unnamed protein product [Closterium sp. Naga37s-1]|nr:unnamed protein product [Closterium sp. Naga37s-1]
MAIVPRSRWILPNQADDDNGREKAERRLTMSLRHLVPHEFIHSVPRPLSLEPCSSIVPLGGAATAAAVTAAAETLHPHGHIDEEVVHVGPEFSWQAHVRNRLQYDQMWRQSIENPTRFWGNVASEFFWHKKWDAGASIVRHNFDVRNGPVAVEWFPGGYTNVCFNAVDRHVAAGRGETTAMLWEGNDPGDDAKLSFNELLDQICQLSNFLRAAGVRKGDTVCLYMPMVPELPIAMLACARIGAIHSVVFGGFSAESLAGRMVDCRPKVLLTCSAVRRGDKVLALKDIADSALRICSDRENVHIQTCLVYDNSRAMARHECAFTPGRDVWWQEVVGTYPTDADVEWMASEDPLFMLYTSGSTGKPKGVVHTTGGYMVYAATTFKFAFDYKPGDVYWCTADCGWITGHSYLTYGPLLNGATIVVFEGTPTWPDPGRWWHIVDKYKVTIFYTAPTAIRSLEACGDSYVRRHSRASLRVLGSVGEPINPKAWRWYFEVVGGGRCPISDTWWQTETGGICITPLPGAWPLKPGSASLPFFGIEPVILDQQGNEQEGPCEGYLCLRRPWPGMARTLFGDHARFEATYFSVWKGYYTTGDGARRDRDGYIWLTGRVDDVINVSGHRISTEEVESALDAHPACAEAAVVGYDHEVKGQGVYAFVTLMSGISPSESLRKALKDTVRNEIGSFAAPDVIHWAPGLPKTRSGKIMRRILRKIAANKLDELVSHGVMGGENGPANPSGPRASHPANRSRYKAPPRSFNSSVTCSSLDYFSLAIIRAATGSSQAWARPVTSAGAKAQTEVMATAVSSALLSGSAAVLDRRGVSDARSSSLRAASSSAAAGSAVSLLPSSSRWSVCLNRLAARASASDSSSARGPLVTDRSHGVLSGEWDKSVSLLSYEDLSHHLQSVLIRGLVEDSEVATTEPVPLTATRRHGIVSGEWDKSVSMLHYEDLSTFFEATLVQGLQEDAEANFVPLEAHRSHGVVSGEWDKSISILSYEDLSKHLLENLPAGSAAPAAEQVVPLMSDKSHGVLSGEWDTGVTNQSYEDVKFHIQTKMAKEGRAN